jgi:hypothetical protein
MTNTSTVIRQPHIIETQIKIFRQLVSADEAADCLAALFNPTGDESAIGAVELLEEKRLVVAPKTNPLPHTSHLV